MVTDETYECLEIAAFHKAVWVCLGFGRREVNWNNFNFRIKRKMKDAKSVSSCNSVNSAIMYNTGLMIKMSFVITLTSITVTISMTLLIKLLYYFQISFKIQKAMSQFIKDTKISEKKDQHFHNLKDKTWYKKYVSVTAIAKLMPANLSTLIVTKFKNRNLSKTNNNFLKNLAIPISWSFFACFGNHRI